MLLGVLLVRRVLRSLCPHHRHRVSSWPSDRTRPAEVTSKNIIQHHVIGPRWCHFKISNSLFLATVADFNHCSIVWEDKVLFLMTNYPRAIRQIGQILQKKKVSCLNLYLANYTQSFDCLVQWQRKTPLSCPSIDNSRKVDCLVFEFNTCSKVVYFVLFFKGSNTCKAHYEIHLWIFFVHMDMIGMIDLSIYFHSQGESQNQRHYDNYDTHFY